MTGLDLVTAALIELGVLNAVDPPGAEDAQLAINTLTGILDEWNSDGNCAFNEGYVDYTLTPSLSPHTIGPGGTFVVTQRPVSIDAAALNLGGTVSAYIPITVRDAAWYEQQTLPGLTSTVPTDVYYAPAWPLGSLYFWPIPTVAYGVRLWTQTVLASIALTDTVTLPPGYARALMLTLAEALAAPMRAPASMETKQQAAKARSRIFANNRPAVPLMTRDAGLGGSGGVRPTFNYRSGMGR